MCFEMFRFTISSCSTSDYSFVAKNRKGTSNIRRIQKTKRKMTDNEPGLSAMLSSMSGLIPYVPNSRMAKRAVAMYATVSMVTERMLEMANLALERFLSSENAGKTKNWTL